MRARGGPKKVTDRDWMLKHNAHEMARRIEKYWADRGVTMECTVEQMAHNSVYPSKIGFQIRSNLILTGKGQVRP